MSPPDFSSYSGVASLLSKPGANNILVNRGAHAGPALKDADKTTIANWIDSLPNQ
jgi:hypothetical protein